MTKPIKLSKEPKEVQVLTNANLPMEVLSAGAGNEEIIASEIIIPRVLLMQGLSDMVASRKAQQGDIVKSSGLVLGGPDSPVSFIPLTYNLTWSLMEQVGGKFEFRGSEHMTAQNIDLPFEYEEKGVTCRRVKTISLYALLPYDIDAEKQALEAALKEGGLPDPSTALMPVLITFRSTGYTAGKQVLGHFARAKKYNVRGYVSTMTLSCKQEKNDKGSFYVFDVAHMGKTDNSYLSVCEEWYTILTSNKAKVVAEPEEHTEY